ncbi:restriction endonuclease subunit S [Mycoplasma feriruminatoris]|uniref:Restriction endonuclease subunit S n=1 Tax=Mycoplasma feriruminatoris TaxID=1179777 RepID=A0ABY8HYF1_9MOLU|nr:restriction endonuclease subunit S [Mycoplasma feriruminatoris]WFQ93840.1 restriction endonuclease subunit S [Mycoplasma feriruminatoris]
MSEKSLVPKIRFKGFTNAWEQWKVKDIFEITRGYVVSKKEILETKSGEYIYPIYSSQTINDGLLGYYKSYLASNAITWTTDGANAGTVSYRKGRFYATNVCGLLSTKAFTPNLYLAFALSSETYKHVAKVGNPKLMNNTMANIELIITSNLVEQSKISSLFSNLDSLITLHQRKYLALKNFKNTLLEKMFCDEKSKFPRIRFKGFTNAWEQWKVKDIFEITRGYVVSKKEILETKSGEYIYPIYSSQTINDGLLGYYKSYLASNAITWTTDGANAGTVSYRKGRFYATNVCGLLSTKAFTPNLYLAFALSSETYKHVAKVGNPKLMNNTMANIELIITSNLVEQSKISSLFSNLDSLITLHQRKLELLKNIKNTLLEKMFI